MLQVMLEHACHPNKSMSPPNHHSPVPILIFDPPLCSALNPFLTLYLHFHPHAHHPFPFKFPPLLPPNPIHLPPLQHIRLLARLLSHVSCRQNITRSHYPRTTYIFIFTRPHFFALRLILVFRLAVFLGTTSLSALIIRVSRTGLFVRASIFVAAIPQSFDDTLYASSRTLRIALRYSRQIGERDLKCHVRCDEV